MPQRIALLALAGLVASGAWAPYPARGDVDLNGLWRVGVYVTELATTFSDVCSLTVTQSGDALSLSGPCEGAAGSLSLSATIDPLTGHFTGSGSGAGCTALTVAGTGAPHSIAFNGELRCPAMNTVGGLNGSRCGNGQIDGSETCDDGNLDEADCCPSNCRKSATGTACLDDGNTCTTDTCTAAGECLHQARTGTCTDANPCTQGDTCTAGRCVGAVAPDDTPCNDSNGCTTGDRCVAGACVVTPVVCAACEACSVGRGCVPQISTGCKEAPASALVMRRLASDALMWRWQRGAATDVAEFGDPTAATDYELCVYDGALGPGGAPGLVLSARAPAGSNWYASNGGFGYISPDRLPDGLRRIRLKSGVAGKSRIIVKAQGLDLGLPALQSIAAPLTIQLKARGDDGTRCWSTVFADPAANPLQLKAKRSPPPVETRPNIIVIDLDDTRADGIDRMPNLAQMAADGVSFTNSFVTNPLCAPSRASLLTGLHTPHHGVRALGGLIGGAHSFRERGSDRQTIGTWLQAAGYMTGLFGKYINGYGFGPESIQGPGGGPHVPPGWTRWRGMTSAEHFGGVRGGTYRLVDEHGDVTVYDRHADDTQYSTDVLAGEMRTFIADAAAQQRPFLAVWTPYASHAELPGFIPEPAARHFQFFRDLVPWRPPSYGEADVSDKPSFIQQLSEPDFAVGILNDLIRVGAYETLLSVDEQLRVLRADLARLGIDQNTVILLTSDNGSSWGEHRMYFQTKEAPYEEALRVPMIVHDPRSGVRGVSYDATVLNIDVAPTVAELAGVVPPVTTDGASFATWIAGSPPPQWRDHFYIEHWRSIRNDVLEYAGQVADGDQVSIIYGDSRHHPRPTALFEFDSGDGVGIDAIAVPIGTDADASFAQLGATITGAVPATGLLHAPANRRLTIIDRSPALHSVTLVVERDQNQAMTRPPTGDDWFGVRDVASGFTYVEHSGGEVELYDLSVDPDQLENKAADPAYAALRQSFALRLDDLLP